MKKTNYILPVVLFLTVSFSLLFGTGIDPLDTRLLEQPAISKTKIAFIYAGDLWTADINGKNVKRLTTHDCLKTHPIFSPDGKWIAFSADYNNNTDVYIIPSEGGEPKRLTWHPDKDDVKGFTPDGSAVLFTSRRSLHTFRFTQLFTVPIEGGFPTQLPVPYAKDAVYSPDGSQLAYEPFREAFSEWKRYRGGITSEIWFFHFDNYSIEKISQPKTRCNDVAPMWIGNTVYFLSDRNGEFNLFSIDISSKEITQVTHHDDFPVLNASSGNGKIIYEQAGYLHILDPQSGKAEKLTVAAAGVLPELLPHYAQSDRYIRNADISPSGARAVLEYRGEIITLPAEKGDPRNITNTTGTHERSPSWSPDGKSIAYFSDATGEYELHIKSQTGKGNAKSYKLQGTGFYEHLTWSPDCKKLFYSDNGRNLYWINLETSMCKKIGSDYSYEPGEFANHSANWSPDSRWIAYNINTPSFLRRIYIYSIDQEKSYPVTDGMGDANWPVFDTSGKYLYFLVSTEAGPVRDWFSQTTENSNPNYSIYLAVLQKNIPSPLGKESDEETTVNDSQKPNFASKKVNKSKKGSDSAEKNIDIDFDGLEFRILSLPVSEGKYSYLNVGEEGQLYYLEMDPFSGSRGMPPMGQLYRFTLEKRKGELFMPNINGYRISFNKKKLLYRLGFQLGITSINGNPKPGQGKLNQNAIQVYVEPKAEWAQIYDEAWRINRDYFYDPNMHGVDWKAMKDKYAVFLPHLSCRSDLNRVLQWMCSELSVGHHRVGGGDIPKISDSIPGGLLGADYSIENGRFRFKKIYGGLNWNPDLRSPLTEPGVDVKTGDYLLAVNGKELYSNDNLFRYFENTTDKIVEITVGPTPDGKGSRVVNVVPIRSDYSLRNRDWVEGNIKKVDEATNGRVAYVHVPDTSTTGYIYFKRYFYPQVHKDAIIIDERYNAGGSVPDYYIDLLTRPWACNWATRYGADIETPFAAIQGPKIMLIDENAGSGGDLLPWLFRKFKIGPLVGRRTWGGLVGILGYPTLMDGGRITAPNIAIWNEDGWIVENVGVPPDIEVEQTPSEVIAGHDPQLEKAIEIALKELENNPPKKLKRPPFPDKSKK